MCHPLTVSTEGFTPEIVAFVLDFGFIGSPDIARNKRSMIAEAFYSVQVSPDRAKTPLACLEVIQPIAKKRLRILETPGFVLFESFF